MRLTPQRSAPERPCLGRRAPGRLLGAAVAALALVVVTACGSDPPRELAGIVREPGPPVDQVALPDLSQGGAPFPIRAEPGELLVVFFGFTNCPDYCPTTLADVRSALRQMDDPDADRISLAVVTVDPERDIPVLVDYAQTFVDDAHALATEDPDLLRAAADPFGVNYTVEVNEDGEVEVGHTTHLYVVDDAGQLVLTWQHGIPSEDIAADLAQLLEGQVA